ncbi:hypothetical protein FH972_014936 [Carpinus fangiana]|uniref:Uncharacterized protein n=1 Tax=Carpinus fangiana TaxID=176857 RepID=A0A5N6RB85_9ROSI|nr:hypothetical protein FH972_014936 [Carpinus fangiana]
MGNSIGCGLLPIIQPSEEKDEDEDVPKSKLLRSTGKWPCGMCPDLSYSEKATTETIIAGVAPVKMYVHTTQIT